MELLRQAIAGLRAQTRPVDDLIVVDNASSDGTTEMLASDHPDITVLALPENKGATGGFYEAIKAAYQSDADWIWVLDDDSIAKPAALAALLSAIERRDGDEPPALLCSRVEWTDGRPHAMNLPVLRRRDAAALVESVRSGLLPVRAASWVSLFLARSAVDRAGLPPEHFFYQADDIEYSARILRNARGYLVPESVVEHRTPTQHTAVDDHHRFYYHARNTVLMLRGPAWRWDEKPTLVWFLFWTSLVYLRRNRASRKSLINLGRALFDGARLRPLPAADYP